VSLGFLVGCNELGRKVGPDFKIVGFDDIEDAAQAFPALTSVRCDVSGFGRQIAATILNWLENGVMPAAESRTEVQLIERQSSAAGGSQSPSAERNRLLRFHVAPSAPAGAC
jgi:LacI family transcriptional regulator